VEEPTNQTQEETQVEAETIKSQLKINIRAKGMINLQLNVTIVRNMVITYMNVERNNMILGNKMKILSKKNQNHGACFYLATLHKKIRRIYGFLDPRCNNHMA
jgi:hypothetical protein